MKRILISFLFVIVLFNFIMFCWVYYEAKLYNTENKWLYESQILDPETPSNNSSVILIHGFVGSPFDMKPLAEHLYQKGYRVIIPKIKGQTWDTPAYYRGDYSSGYYIEWLRKIVKQENNRTGQKPYLVGFSMGGTLSTIIASENRIKKLVLIAPFFNLPQIGDTVWKLSKIFKYLIPFVPKISKGQINDKGGYSKYNPGSLIVSLAAFNQLGDLVGHARKIIHKVKTSTLIIMSRNDNVASFSDTYDLFHRKTNVHIIEKNRSNHILLYDHDSHDSINSIDVFISSK